MFALTEEDRHRRVLGVADGPASFNAEATRRGWKVTSVDPIYQFSAADIEARFHAAVDGVFDQVLATPDHWAWSYHRDPGALRAHRAQVLVEFSADFAGGRQRGRYVTGELPHLPFTDGAFELALCSHLLFLYADLLELDFHIRSLSEMLRVAREVRVFPLVSLDSKPSRHLIAVVDHFTAMGYAADTRKVDYELQRGGNEVLVLSAG